MSLERENVERDALILRRECNGPVEIKEQLEDLIPSTSISSSFLPLPLDFLLHFFFLLIVFRFLVFLNSSFICFCFGLVSLLFLISSCVFVGL